MKMNKEVVMVRLSDIIPNRFQPRLTFDEEALNELANSIKEHGIIQPLILRDLGSKYEIIAGERRYKASTLAGLTEVPAIIGSMDDQTSAELALIENIQRKDLSAIEEAKSYKKILDMGNFTQEELAKRMGKSQSTIANKMRLLSLTNEVQVALMNNLISERHARCLLQIKDEDKQKEVLNKIITDRMNVRDTDDYIKNMLGISKVDSPGQNPNKPENISNISDIPNAYASSNPEETTDASEIINPEITSQSEENPNVYTQTNNVDFIDISSLNNEETPINNNIKTALNDLNIVNTSSNIFNDNKPSIEDKEVQKMENIPNISDLESPILTEPSAESKSNISKLKLATAIRLAKDTVEDIKTAGYTVTMEEVDSQKDYQIIIKVQK
ncbi:MAG: ParB/RepB/Spo0J family partition protein [Bacilli bacterium]